MLFPATRTCAHLLCQVFEYGVGTPPSFEQAKLNIRALSWSAMYE